MYMKRRYMISILIVVFGILFWAITRDYANKIPEPIVKDISIAPKVLPAQKPDVIIVSSPLPESTVTTSPIVIKGKVRGNWLFEATAPVVVVNWDGLIIGEGYIKADEGNDWMTTNFVPFTGTISYDKTKLGAYNYGSIILKKNNASGEPQYDDSLEFKILFP
jgi:Immunoglobulin-like domain of bacterial spore germination